MKLYDIKLGYRDNLRAIISQKHVKDGKSHGVYCAYSPTSVTQGREYAIQDIGKLLEGHDCEVVDELPELNPKNQVTDIKVV